MVNQTRNTITPGSFTDPPDLLKVIVSFDIDSSVTNEIQVLSISNDTITLSKSGGSVKLPSGADNWGTQYVKLNSDSLIKGKGTTGAPLKIDTTKIATQYDISGFLSTEVDGSVTNESQTFGIGHMSWPYLYVSAAGGSGGGAVFLKGKGINTITNSVDSILVTGTEVDGSITNEIQNLSQSKAGNNVTVNISSGTGTAFSVADADSSATNEIQSLTYNSSTRIMNISSGTGDTIPIYSTTSGTAGLTPGSNSGGSSVFLNGSGNWSVPSGAGNVSKVGTPVNDQVGIWTGDGTIEGDIDLTFDGNKLTAKQLHISSPTAGTADYDKFLVLDLSGTEVKYRTGAEMLSDIGAKASFTSGNLTESVTGLQFDNTRQVIGGAATLSLTSGYVIPTTTEQTVS